MSIEKVNPYITYHRRTEEKLIAGAPIDLSYLNATSCSDLAIKSPQSTRTGKLPKRSSNNLFLTSSLWLSHNCFTSLTGLDALSQGFLYNPTQLSWLDVSFNNLMDIDPCIIQFPNLKILYFHSNNISEMQSILKLQHLKKLRTLTLHGNPIASNSQYRGFVITVLPQLLNLDFSRIINIERKKALPKGFFQMIKKLN